MTFKECAYCSFNNLEHDRAMVLSHPLLRHAFLEKPETNEDLTKTSIALPSLAQLAKMGKDPHIIDQDSFEIIQDPKNYKFTGLGQIYEGEDPKPASSIGMLAAQPFTNEERLRDRRDRRTETGEGKDTSYTYTEDPQYASRYSKWQEAVTQHFTPISVIRSRKTQNVFEGYKTSDGRLIFIGTRPGEHGFQGSEVSEGEHVRSHHRPTDESKKITDALTGNDIAISQSTQGPQMPEIKTKGPGGVTQEKARQIERDTIENWSKSQGTNYEGYMSGLAKFHQDLPAHTHPIDLSQGDVYEMSTTKEGHQVLVRTSEPKTVDTPAPALSVIHDLLRRTNSIPQSSSQTPRTQTQTPNQITPSNPNTSEDDPVSEQTLLDRKEREESYRAIEESMRKRNRNSPSTK